MTDRYENTIDTGLTDEQIAEGMAALGISLHASGEANQPHPVTQYQPGAYVATVVEVEERPSWDVDPAARPAAVTKALDALVQSVDGANELAERLWSLPGERAAEAAAFEAEAQAADREGRSPKFARPRDWDKERAVLEAQHRGRRQVLDAARVTYAQAVRDSLPEWFQALAARQEPARLAALEAAASARAADAAAFAWSTAVVATMRAYEGLHPAAHTPRLDLRSASAIGRAVDELTALLTSADEAVTGSWLTSTLEPPLHERKQMAESGGAALEALLAVELAEGFEVSDYTKPYAAATGRWGTTLVTPSGQRFVQL